MVAPPLFETGLCLVIFDATYSIWVISELFGAVLIPKLRQRGAIRVKRDRGSGALVILTVLLSISVAFAFGYNGIGLLPDWAYYLGTSLMAGSRRQTVGNRRSGPLFYSNCQGC